MGRGSPVSLPTAAVSLISQAIIERAMVVRSAGPDPPISTMEGKRDGECSTDGAKAQPAKGDSQSEKVAGGSRRV